MAKVRFLQDGNTVAAQEEKDENLLDLEGIQLDRNRLTDTFRDTNDFTTWSDRYKGLSGSKIRSKVSRRAREMASKALSGEMKLNDISTFVHNNQAFESDGTTKRRFLRKYDANDENTVNAIAARYLMDVMNRSKYTKKKPDATAAVATQTETETEQPTELPQYTVDYSSILGPDQNLTIQALSRITNKDKRVQAVRGLLSNYITSATKERDSQGKYSADTDWSFIDRYSGVLNHLKDYNTYNDRYNDIFTTDSSLAGVISGLIGDYGGNGGNGGGSGGGSDIPDSEKTEEQLLQERLQAEVRRKALADAERQLEETKRLNDLNDYRKNTWNSLSSDWSSTFNLPKSDFYDKHIEDIRKAYVTTGPDGKPAVDTEYLRYIEDTIGKIIGDYRREYLNKPKEERDPEYLSGEFNSEDKNLGALAGKTRIGRLMAYTKLLNELTGGKNYNLGNTTYDPYDQSIFAVYNGSLQRFNLKQAVNLGIIDRETANKYLDSGFEFKTSRMAKGGVLKAQLGMRIQDSDYSNIKLSDDVVDRYQKIIEEQNRAEAERLRDEANSRQIEKEVFERKGSLSTPEAKAALERKSSIVDSPADVARLTAAGSNLMSAIAALTGFSPASAGLGLVGTAANFTADAMDDSVTAGQMWKNGAMNVGLDVLSLVPFLGASAAGTKVVRAARSIVPILGAMAIVNADYKGTYDKLNKLVNGGWKSMSKQDWSDLMTGMSQIMGLTRTGASGVGAYRSRGAAATKSGKVRLKVNKDGKNSYIDVNEKDYLDIRKSGKGSHGEGRYNAQNETLQKMYGENVSLTGVQRGGLFSNKRYVYDQTQDTNRPLMGGWIHDMIYTPGGNTKAYKQGIDWMYNNKFSNASKNRNTRIRFGENAEVQRTNYTPPTPESKPSLMSRAKSRFSKKGKGKNETTEKPVEQATNTAPAAQTVEVTTAAPVVTNPTAKPVATPAVSSPAVVSASTSTAAPVTTTIDIPNVAPTPLNLKAVTYTPTVQDNSSTFRFEGSAFPVIPQRTVKPATSNKPATSKPSTVNPSTSKKNSVLAKKKEEHSNKKEGKSGYRRKKHGSKLLEGGLIMSFQTGGTVRNTYTNTEPSTFNTHLNLWGQVVKPAIIGKLDGLDTSEKRGEFSKGVDIIQSKLKDTRDVSGTGYGQDVIKKSNQSLRHQIEFQYYLPEGNERIGKAYEDKLLFRRGNTGDNAAGRWADGFHGNASALRTAMVTGSKNEDELFRNSQDYKDVRGVGAMRNMTYLPIKHLSDENTKYYGFQEMPELKAAGIVPPTTPSSSNPFTQIEGIELEPIEDDVDLEFTPIEDRDVKTKPTDLDKRKGNAGDTFKKLGVGLLGLADPIAATIVNNRAVRKAKEGLRPDLVDAYRTFSPVENDYWAKRNAQELAARGNRFGSRVANETADASLGNAAYLSAHSKGEDAIRQGDAVSSQRFYTTRHQAMEHENNNTARWTQAANANRASMNKVSAIKANMDANRMTHNYSQIWQPWMRENKAYAMMDATKRQAQAAQIQNLKNSEMFRVGVESGSGFTDPTEQQAWLRTNQGREYLNKFQREATENNPMYQSTRSYIRPGDYFPFFGKRGMRVRTSYSMNLGLDSFTKEFFKNERNARDNNTRSQIASATGARMFARDTMRNITDFNKMMTYANKKK